MIVLFAAALHASWNALVKSTGDKFVSMAAITIGHVPLALLAMPFFPVPAPESWPFLVGSVIIHTAYQFSLVSAYRMGDFTQVYPIARGSAPAIVTAVSIFLLGVVLLPNQIVGIGFIVAGIFCMALLKQTNGLRNPKAVGVALMTGCFIAGYSLLDGLGARAAGTAFGYIAWMTTINAIAFSALIAVFRRGTLSRVFTEGLSPMLLGGSTSVIGYVLVIWAMTQAPVALVSALRETSTVFALFIGVTFLKERLSAGKILATILVVTGLCVLRFGDQF